MDIETLTNHISKLGKHLFENACRIVLTDCFHQHPINVDGPNDGGTDYASYDKDGTRKRVAYQITTQRTDIKNKAYRDAEKAIEKLGVTKYYFMTTIDIKETETIKLQAEIEDTLKISATCLGSRHIAGLLLSENLLNKFLDESNYPLPRDRTVNDLDYRETALHSYTLFSKDAADMREGIYDDSLLFILSSENVQNEELLIKGVIKFLAIDDTKYDYIKRRIGALFGKNLLKRTSDGQVVLSDMAKNDLAQRKRIYEEELRSLSSAQIDLMREEYKVNWTLEDSKKISIWIADAFISEQLTTLKEAKASIIANPIFNSEGNGKVKLFKFLEEKKGLKSTDLNECVGQILDIASSHPFISKIIRASVYVALEGGNPISSAKALGASRWSDFNMLLDSSVALPYICCQLFSDYANRFHQTTDAAISRAKNLDVNLFITYYYVNECAGHLLTARKYTNINLDDFSLQYSRNIFVSTYYTYKSKGIKVPPTLLDYLRLFSPSIMTEMNDQKRWVRSIMIDVQSLLNKGQVELLETPQYSETDTEEFKYIYGDIVSELKPYKKQHLINDDVWALQVTNDRIINEREHWIILTLDKTMISFGNGNRYKGWITNPYRFIDFTNLSKPLSESQFVSLVHSVASYSDATLSAAARIIDRIIMFASKEMQNWEFKTEIEKFKTELLQSLNFDSDSIFEELDRKTDDFLQSHGIAITADDEVDDNELLN